MKLEDFIIKLNHGQCYVVPESDYGSAEIWRINDTYILFEIPTYGGEPTFHDTFRLDDINRLVKTINAWT